MQYLAIFIGGGLGSLSRFYLSRLNPSLATGLPLGTISANIMACFILGFVATYLGNRPIESMPLKALIATGFCGGFSTFSTFSMETVQLLRQDMATTALLNVVISLVTGLLAIVLGYYLANRLA